MAGRACWVYHPARINPAPRFPSRPLEYLYHPARIDPALRASASLSALYHIARINPAPRPLAHLLMVGAQPCCWFIHTPAVELIGGLSLPRFLDSAKSLGWVPYDITAPWRVACNDEESHRGGGRCGLNCFYSGQSSGLFFPYPFRQRVLDYGKPLRSPLLSMITLPSFRST